MVKLSVIIPVHNVEKYLRKCVESVMLQTLSDIEIILVENLSKDSSYDICLELAKQDSRIKILKLDKSGLSYARNKGIEIAVAPYVAFVDSDDTIALEMYSEMLSFAEANNLDMVTCNMLKRYEYRSDRHVFKSDNSAKIYSSLDFLKMNFKGDISPSACVMLCKKRLFDNIKFPVGAYFEDLATTWKLIIASSKCGHISKEFYFYLRHRGSIVHSIDFRKSFDCVSFYAERLKYIHKQSGYTLDEQLKLGAPSARTFFKFLIKMIENAKNDDEIEKCLQFRDFAMTLPYNYKYKKKRYKKNQYLVVKHWKLLCLLKRGKFI